jgi:hypothetical protein
VDILGAFPGHHFALQSSDYFWGAGLPAVLPTASATVRHPDRVILIRAPHYHRKMVT